MRVFVTFPYMLGRVGVGRTALEQVNGLARLGHEVRVAAPVVAPDITLEPGVTHVETRTFAGRTIPRRFFPGRWTAMDWHDRRASRALAQWAREAPVDIVHSWPLSGARTLRAARTLGATTVREAPNTHTGHGFDVVAAEYARLGMTVDGANSHHPDPEHLRREEAEWAAADAILCPSDAVVDSFRERGFAPERLVRHRYGADLTTAAGEVSRRRDDDRPLHALFLGAAEPRKGLHYALAAWSGSTASAGGSFTIAGRFAPGYREVLGSALDAPGVEAIGFVDDPAAALAQADVLLLPSIEEGSAIVTYEAQAAGCVPLVSMAAGAYLDDGVQGLVHDVGNVATLTSQLDLLDRDRTLLRRLSEAGLRRRDDLGWDGAARALVEAYASARERRAGR